MTTFVWEH